MCGNGSGTKQQGLSKVFNQIRISIHNSVSPIYQMYISNNVYRVMISRAFISGTVLLHPYYEHFNSHAKKATKLSLSLITSTSSSQ